MRFLIRQLGVRLHHRAHEKLAGLFAILVERHAHREARAFFAFAQRAEIIRYLLGQHRHDAIGEVDRVAAQLRFTVELAAGADVMRDVGDRDNDAPSAVVLGVRVRFGKHRVVVIACINGIDGQQRHVAQIGAAIHRRRCKRFAFGENAFGKVLWDAVRVDRDQRDLPLVFGVAEAFEHDRARGHEASAAHEIETHEIAIARLAGIIGKDRPAFHFLAFDRLDRAAAAFRCAEYAEQAAFFARQFFDRLGVVLCAAIVARAFRQIGEHAVADADFGIDA